MLHRLIYTSKAAQALEPSLVEALLARARVANARRDLTGALAFNSDCFLQALEGSAEALSALYGKLVVDPRHHQLQLIEFARIEERRFDRWSMAFAAADERTSRVIRRYSASGRLQPGVLTAPAAVNVLTELVAAQPTLLGP